MNLIKKLFGIKGIAAPAKKRERKVELIEQRTFNAHSGKWEFFYWVTVDGSDMPGSYSSDKEKVSLVFEAYKNEDDSYKRTKTAIASNLTPHSARRECTNQAKS